MNEDKLMPIHPGEVLLEEFIKPMNLSQNQIALALGVPEQRINEIVHGKQPITADIALRLARYGNGVYTDSFFSKIVLKVFLGKYFTIL